MSMSFTSILQSLLLLHWLQNLQQSRSQKVWAEYTQLMLLR